MGTRSLAKRGLPMGLVLIFVAVFFLGLPPAHGRTILETFDNNRFNPDLFWVNASGSPNKPEVTVVSKHLEVAIRGPITGMFMGGLQMLGDFQLVGDFDVQVDFNLAAWPANSGVGAGIVSPLFDVRRIANNGQTGETYAFGIPGKPMISVPTADKAGKLRLRRTGATVQAFYWEVSTSSWKAIGGPVTATALAAPTQVYIGIYAGGFTVPPPLTVVFDNIKIITPDFSGAIMPLWSE